MSHVDLGFKITGTALPVDHGYLLFSAISDIIPELHGDEMIGIHPISGTLIGNRSLVLNEKSRLIIRTDSEKIKNLLCLAGKKLVIGGNNILVGIPTVRPLKPSANLYSRLVVIKGFTEPDSFLESAKKQLSGLGIKGEACLIRQDDIKQANIGKRGGSHSEYLRRTIKIHDKEIVGFAVRVEGLNAEESICLQEKGLGGRRRFGCGIFIPAR